MIVLAGLVIGAVWGAMVARKRGGKGLDMAQYGAAYGIALGIVGLFVSIAISQLT